MAGGNYKGNPDAIVHAFGYGEQKFKVERIINHHCTKSGRQLLVHWHGYSSAKDMSLTEIKLDGSLFIVAKYKKKHKLA